MHAQKFPDRLLELVIKKTKDEQHQPKRDKAQDATEGAEPHHIDTYDV